MAQHKASNKSGGLRRASAKSMKKVASRSTKSGLAKGEAAMPTSSAGEDAVSMDRRRTDRRDEVMETVATTSPAAPQLERRQKVNRRRQIDPTTCERDYTDQEVEFMNALDDYKRKSGRMFPTCSEVLEVLRGLGYVKLTAAELGSRPEDSASEASAKPMPSDWPQSAVLDSTFSDDNTTDAREPELVY